MQIIKTDRLTVQQVKEIGHLIDECRSLHPIRTSFPFEDGSVFFLAYEKCASSIPVLVCALALIMPETDGFDETAECLAFTHPSFRKKGYFSAVFEEAGTEFEETSLLIPVDGQDPAVIPVLETIGAEYDSCEYRMELALSCPCLNDAPPLSGRRLICRSLNGPDSSVSYSFSLESDAPLPIAVCRTASFGANVCLYSFLVEEDYRGRGFGEEALLSVIEILRSRGNDVLFLHVSGDNDAAVSLYKKTGFRITETLSYYLY
ncbi:GNAT family N-acetyltransferase [Clostridium transplantifaecale]|uniref:GNAT family N-acetyltransferase n=1 Tax=Clostridium transplantifaecale TaxID=2479838 RepID=UPI000F632501|nr:GNAT family N-acetyltransferase [Clostridium transplantifaecale]